ncbi:MAG TPA: 4-(cytidine 5'-diphospho)-2-C-methyl-D-erythritol kinase [Firmicutes bacterium]|jgi:4-diphosphocytidyl-2-C-methyl-D-erythritol kinase|nr:4-(cytidine 5'-diphospho)-2-C-methyl-D-erythritol kinase [Bacillota bacterium]HHT43800.1 4-(cytidine 5'-diphospho)-2-C-methyl-D-erythritol kinase [Bacillota bacterium]
MDEISLKAYAKVNLTLDIVGRRSDGYHLLNSIMQSVSLADVVTLSKRPKGIVIHSDHPQLPLDETNTCWRAFTAFTGFTKLEGGVEVYITKSIPMAAGLGGASADAAAVLHGLNKLYGTKLSTAELQELGLSVGADVPFCLQGGTCLVQGIGEVVSAAAAFPRVSLVLVKPEAAVFTAQVYSRLKPSAHGTTYTAQVQELIAEGREVQDIAGALGNALETVTAELVPETALWKERLLARGAHGALMSGSGPTVVGLFTDQGRARDFQSCYQDQAQIFVVELADVGVEEMDGGDR